VAAGAGLFGRVTCGAVAGGEACSLVIRGVVAGASLFRRAGDAVADVPGAGGSLR